MANDQFKLKEFNLDSKQCRRTTLAPRFGNPPTSLLPLVTPGPATEETAPELEEGGGAPGALNGNGSVVKHYCFATSNRVIGIGSFPLTGSPNSVSTGFLCIH